jgi:tRNA(His) 5'-end guanylyltransferase
MEENITLKDKCREYQKRRDYHVDTDKFIIAHIDGRSFSKMIKNKFQKPFVNNFIDMMNKTEEKSKKRNYKRKKKNNKN